MRILFLGLLVAVGLAAGSPSLAVSGYVFFHSTVGEWLVICWRELGKEQKYCRLSAPPPSLDYRLAPNVIEVREHAPGAFQVIVTVRDRPAPGMPLFLRVDARPLHESPIEKGLAWWSGDEALKIILEMRAGSRLVYRVQTAPDGMPRDMRIPLGTFSEAFDIYRRTLREHGLLPADG